MVDKSQSQRNLMAAAAHTRGGFGGVPQKVGRDFIDADAAQGNKFSSAKKKSKAERRYGSEK